MFEVMHAGEDVGYTGAFQQWQASGTFVPNPKQWGGCLRLTTRTDSLRVCTRSRDVRDAVRTAMERRQDDQ